MHCIIVTLFADVKERASGMDAVGTNTTMGRSRAQEAQAQHVGVGVGLTEWLYLTLTAVFFCACAYVQGPHFVVELCTHCTPFIAHGIDATTECKRTHAQLHLQPPSLNACFASRASKNDQICKQRSNGNQRASSSL